MTDVDTNFDASPDAGELDSGGDFLSDLGSSFAEQVESVNLGEDGSIDMRIRSAEPETSEAQPVAEPAAAPASGDQATDTPKIDMSDFETRYKEVQSWSTKVAQDNADLRERLARVEGQMSTQDSDQDTDSVEIDPETADQFKAYLEQNLSGYLTAAGVDPAVVAEMQTDFAVNKELRTAYAKHDDFQTYVPVIDKIIKDNPESDISFEQAYQLATTMYSVESPNESAETAEPVDAQPTSTPQETPAAAPTQQPTPSRQDLEQRANKVATLTSHSAEGNSANHTPERIIKTPRDAAELTLEQAQEGM